MAKSMSKSQLLAHLAEGSGMTRKDVAKLLDLLVETAFKQAKSVGEFTLPGVGKLLKKQRGARMGRNPATGQQIQIPAKTVVKFRVSKIAKEAILK